MIEAIIIDDEIAAIKSLKWEIDNLCEDIEIIDTFTDPVEAISAINYTKPDCVFLDIEMPKMDGFHLLTQLKYREFDLIITTAYDVYALKAFKESAIDYLLKPVDTDDLKRALDKIKVRKQNNELGKEIESLLKPLLDHTSKPKVALHLNGKTIFILPNQILYCKANGNYTEIYFADDTKELVSKKIKDVEMMLNNKTYYRSHNSYLVNISYVKEYVKSEGQYLVLENGVTIPVSRVKRHEIMKVLSN